MENSNCPIVADIKPDLKDYIRQNRRVSFHDVDCYIQECLGNYLGGSWVDEAYDKYLELKSYASYLFRKRNK